ncbi:gamma-glutamyl-gamma-aminobutyrate hydrolase family protein [Microbacterium murale]|uniref:Glutamine amidotransferase n=1 Tax=Microbacterium murale TaxID=1081040 RepID=A0ABU0P4U5_9MICO|nr:gamma-glutamyl-gamma-aminobutyrate hydrolase family protein [Microbacterium murale]MDQ0642340.1 putative glutamine amidotransferase [Microbacterium murale]
MSFPARRVAVLHLRTRRPSNPRYQRELDMLNSVAVATIESLGWSAQVVATAERPVIESLTAAREADMVVLMGGEDVDPRLYGDNPDYPGSGHHESRADSTQIAVVLEAMQHGKPLLGICRGVQLINVALGGTLVQHLPTVAGHRGIPSSGEGFVTNLVTLEPESDLDRDVDAADPVMCTHHQAVEILGNGLVVAGRSVDGVVEAILHESAPITGVQWHPEHPRTAGRQLRALLLRLERQLAASRV